MQPPFSITPKILTLHSGISRHCGLLEGWDLSAPKPELRRSNRIRAIQGSLAIEGNTLSLDQVTAVLEGRRVIGPKREILEALNAFKAYDHLDSYDIHSVKSFLKAHKMLMEGLLDGGGAWRRGEVGIQKGSAVAHVAPPASRVPALMDGLFKHFRQNKETTLLVMSCVFHYEISFIHPFLDGNGRVARLWQTAMLRHHHPAFAFVPVESMVKQRQKEYYRALESSDRKGEATPFIEFMLAAISGALQEFMVEVEVPVRTADTRLEAARARFGKAWFSRKEYLERFKRISSATASRDLKAGSDEGLLEKAGDKATARYRFRA